LSAVARLRESFASGPRRPLRILGASGQLGYGIPTPALRAGLDHAPDMIGCDMGSIDIGPAYLGSGAMAPTRVGARRDLRKVLHAALEAGIPLIIGSAGSAGAGPHMEATLEMLREIAAEDGLTFRMASIGADIPRDTVTAAIRARRVQPLDGMPDLTEDEVEHADQLVGQMGLDAFRRALETDPDVLIAGRACDTAIFATLPVMLGFPRGLATHMAKIVECASLCCVPGGRDTILATLDDESFTLESMAPQRAATPASVAAHSLYEQSSPYEIIEPDGRVDLHHVRYEALDARRTRVSGAEWIPASKTTIKLEGARFLGHRALLLAASADPRFIARSADIFDEVAAVVAGLVCEDSAPDYDLRFRVYGVDGVIKWPEPPAAPPREVFVMGQCIAPTPERAQEVIRTTKQYLLHHGYEGRLSTAGNLAFPLTPPEVSAGPAYRFNVYHLLETNDTSGLFPVRIEEIRQP
jgi:hypothetical protein